MKMHKSIRPLTLLIFGLQLQVAVAQSPERMSYQAVVRDASNTLVTGSPVGMRLSILQGSGSGSAVYVETQTPTTNANGLATLQIGGGSPVSGNFSTIDWANGPYFLKTETDPLGGTDYTITGTSQLLSVPYALYSATSGSSIPGPPGPPGPAGNSPTIASASGTAELSPGLEWALVPGMSTTVTIPALSTYTVLIQTDGGVQLNSGSQNSVGYTDVAIFIDDVQVGAGRRVPVQNTSTVVYAVNAFGFSVLTTLGEGTHTVALKAKKFSNSFTSCIISSAPGGSTLMGNPPLQASLNVLEFP